MLICAKSLNIWESGESLRSYLINLFVAKAMIWESKATKIMSFSQIIIQLNKQKLMAFEIYINKFLSITWDTSKLRP